MEMTVQTKAGLIKARANSDDDYPSIDLFVNDKLYCLLEFITDDGDFFVRVYNDEEDDPIFNQKVCTT